jgi:transcriptional regulator with XRE-family HTH domain
MGAALCALRHGVGLSQRELGWAAEMGADHVGNLERGQRRPRRSSLERLVLVFAALDPGLDGDELLEGLCDLAGPALAPESAFSERVARRRDRRRRRRERLEESARHLNSELHRNFDSKVQTEARRLLRAEMRKRGMAP